MILLMLLPVVSCVFGVLCWCVVTVRPVLTPDSLLNYYSLLAVLPCLTPHTNHIAMLTLLLLASPFILTKLKVSL